MTLYNAPPFLSCCWTWPGKARTLSELSLLLRGRDLEASPRPGFLCRSLCSQDPRLRVPVRESRQLAERPVPHHLPSRPRADMDASRARPSARFCPSPTLPSAAGPASRPAGRCRALLRARQAMGRVWPVPPCVQIPCPRQNSEPSALNRPRRGGGAPGRWSAACSELHALRENS